MTKEGRFKTHQYPWGAGERLFRAVWPAIWMKSSGRLSSSAFVDDTQDGLSVDRDGGRSVNESADFMQAKLFKTCYIATLSVGQALCQCGVCVLPRPSHNPWHCELYDSAQNKLKPNNEQCQMLAKCAHIVAEPKEKEQTPSDVSYPGRFR